MARTQNWSQVFAIAAFSLAAVTAVGATLLSAAGALPWLELPLRFGTADVPYAGAALQVGLTIILLLLCAFLPSSIRVLRLEATHRDFAVRMDDVARAYWMAHAADRGGAFQLPREYDAVRERLQFLKAHPDLEDLDHGILELAAEMSHESRELAQIYSDEKLNRAREVLALRRHEAEELNERIAHAHAATLEIRKLKDEVDFEEDVVRARIERLREDLAEILPFHDIPDPDAAPEERRARLGVVPGE